MKQLRYLTMYGIFTQTNFNRAYKNKVLLLFLRDMSHLLNIATDYLTSFLIEPCKSINL